MNKRFLLHLFHPGIFVLKQKKNMNDFTQCVLAWLEI